MSVVTLRELWLQSILASDTLIVRDKSARGFQYLARMLAGITDIEIFTNLLRALSLSRKTLRFWKPVKALKRIEDVQHDTGLDTLDKNLTIAEIGSDGLYAALDHITFLQRIGGLKWMSPKQVDNLDRFLEFFWLTEVLPVIWRETRKLLRLRVAATESDAKLREDVRLIASGSPYLLNDERKKALLLLFKAVCCDLPCSLYFMRPANFKNKRIHKTWCGALGVTASLISLKMNWPQVKSKR